MNTFKLDLMTLLVLLVAVGFAVTVFWKPGAPGIEQTSANSSLSQNITVKSVASRAVAERITPVNRLVKETNTPAPL